jgi:hypothetical protein
VFEKNNKTKQIHIRFTECEMEELNKLCEEKNINKSDLIKKLIKKEIEIMSEKIKVKRLGVGTGEGQTIEILNRNKVIEIIEDIDNELVVRKAWKAFNKGFKNGYAVLNLETGEIESLSLGNGESDQAIDYNYIFLYEFEMNFDIGDMELRDEEGDLLEDDNEIEGMIEEILFEDNIIDSKKITIQLNEWYK